MHLIYDTQGRVVNRLDDDGLGNFLCYLSSMGYKVPGMKETDTYIANGSYMLLGNTDLVSCKE